MGWGRGEVPTLRGAHLQQGDQQGQRGTFRGSEESLATGLWGVGRSEACAHGTCHGPAHPSLGCVPPGGEEGWVQESGVWRVDPGRGWLLAVRRWSVAAGGRGSMARKVGGGGSGNQGSGVPWLSGTQRAGPPLLCPSPSAGPVSLGSGRGAHLSRLAHPSKAQASLLVLGLRPTADRASLAKQVLGLGPQIGRAHV